MSFSITRSGHFASASPGQPRLSVDYIHGGGSPTTLTLVDVSTPGVTYNCPVGEQPIFSRSQGVTYGGQPAGNIPVLFTYTGTAPSNVQARVVNNVGTQIVPWQTLTSVTFGGSLNGQGFLPAVPQGINYLLQIRDGLNPSNPSTISNGTHKFGVGVVVMFNGQSNMEGILSLGASYLVPGTSQTEQQYVTSLLGTGYDNPTYGGGAQGSPPYSSNGLKQNLNGSTEIFARVVAASLFTKYGYHVPVMCMPYYISGNPISTFLPVPTSSFFINSGASATTFGLSSPENFQTGDFEIFFWHQGEGDESAGTSYYLGQLQVLYQGLLTWVSKFGRTSSGLSMGVCLLSSQGPGAVPEYIRQADQLFIAGAQAGTLPSQPNPWPLVECACSCVDVSTAPVGQSPPVAALHITNDIYRRLAMHRMMQTAMYWLGASGNGPSGQPFSGKGPTIDPAYTRTGLTVVFNVVHQGGTALTVPTPGNPPTGFYANTSRTTTLGAAQFNGTNIALTVSLINSNTQIQIVFPGGTTFPCYLKYQGNVIVGGYPTNGGIYDGSTLPDFSNAIYDNVQYPLGLQGLGTGTDLEAYGMPLQPTIGAITIS